MFNRILIIIVYIWKKGISPFFDYRTINKVWFDHPTSKPNIFGRQTVDTVHIWPLSSFEGWFCWGGRHRVVGPTCQHISPLLRRPPPSLSLPCLSVGRSWCLLPPCASVTRPSMCRLRHTPLPAPVRRILRTARGLCAAEEGQRTAAGLCAAVEHYWKTKFPCVLDYRQGNDIYRQGDAKLISPTVDWQGITDREIFIGHRQV
jgi:hypothetical protein